MASSTSSWPQKSALILCDYQNFILQGQTGGEENAKKAAEKALPLIASARAAEVPVIYVAVRFRKGAPEVSEDNKAFSAYKSAGAIVNLEEVSALRSLCCMWHSKNIFLLGRALTERHFMKQWRRKKVTLWLLSAVLGLLARPTCTLY